MLNKTSLDERQLWQRGNVFKHAFVFLIVALALEALCKSFGITWAQGPLGGDLAHLGQRGPVLVGVHTPGHLSHGEEPEGVLLRHGPVWGVHRGDGAGLLGGRARPVAGGGALTSAGATTLIGCLMASILGAHLGKTAWDKRHPPEDEE